MIESDADYDSMIDVFVVTHYPRDLYWSWHSRRMPLHYISFITTFNVAALQQYRATYVCDARYPTHSNSDLQIHLRNMIAPSILTREGSSIYKDGRNIIYRLYKLSSNLQVLQYEDGSLYTLILKYLLADTIRILTCYLRNNRMYEYSITRSNSIIIDSWINWFYNFNIYIFFWRYYL